MSDLSKKINKVTKLREELVQLHKERVEEIRKIMFDTFPDLESISWAVYQYYDDESYSVANGYDNGELEIDPGTKEQHEKFSELDDMDGEYLKEAFGEDTKVVLKRDRIYTEEYSDY